MQRMQVRSSDNTYIKENPFGTSMSLMNFVSEITHCPVLALFTYQGSELYLKVVVGSFIKKDLYISNIKVPEIEAITPFLTKSVDTHEKTAIDHCFNYFKQFGEPNAIYYFKTLSVRQICLAKGEPYGVLVSLNTNEDYATATIEHLAGILKNNLHIHMLQKEIEVNQKTAGALISKLDTKVDQISHSLEVETNLRILLEKQLEHQKNHDAGTLMLNRKGFEIALKEQLIRCEQGSSNKFLAVILIHLTNGERIHTRLGSHEFEELLIDYEKKIRQCVNDNISMARVSTTEIAFCVHVSPNDEGYLAKLCEQLASVGRKGFVVKEHEVHIHAYMGIATSYHTDDPDKLINKAYHASVSCKESGAQYTLFTKADSEEQKEFNQLECYLLQAVRNDDLILYFQPKVRPIDQRWIGAEVLLRWKHPILGEISNEALIHMAEQNGLIIELGNFVLRAAIDKASEWATMESEFKVSVNISAKQICDPLFAERLIDLLEQHELPAKNIELELTESCLISNLEVAKANVLSLHEQGVSFSLDDFGTGYASFNYLKQLPFDSIKVDKSFLQNIHDNPNDEAIIRSIISIAKKLKKEVVVEGVENKLHHSFICKENCDIGQGYYYARPMPGDEFEQKFLQRFPPKVANNVIR